MKKKQILQGFMCIGVILLISCNGKIEKDTEKKKNASASFRIVVENIDSMGVKSWDKSEYLQIKNTQIPMLKRETEKTSATQHLSTTYGKVLVRDIKTLLASGCNQTGSHSLLEKLWKELQGFKDAQGYDEVLKIKNVHDKASSFANGSLGSQTVSSYKDTYDASFEKKHIQDAKSYLEDSLLKCKLIKEKLTRLSSSTGYYSRRLNYCESIASWYSRCTNTSKSELNIAVARLNVLDIFTDSKSKDAKASLKQQLANHYDEIQSQKRN